MIWLVMTAYQSNAALSQSFLSVFKLYLNYDVFSIKICYNSSILVCDKLRLLGNNESKLAIWYRDPYFVKIQRYWKWIKQEICRKRKLNGKS